MVQKCKHADQRGRRSARPQACSDQVREGAGGEVVQRCIALIRWWNSIGGSGDASGNESILQPVVGDLQGGVFWHR
ncbi:protein of unknown function [Methanoculleus bourgensis]|uniref:Uncharacterized protein n=1 Tax=Methanoculleus bourgensis TaxID=83986 RepID=A0A0X3BKJ9_9EURY|nr:protein of unknown function [Methanoculleus bourgensis]